HRPVDVVRGQDLGLERGEQSTGQDGVEHARVRVAEAVAQGPQGHAANPFSGILARTANPPPRRRAASSSPPYSARRSRMPTKPCPPEPGGRLPFAPGP